MTPQDFYGKCCKGLESILDLDAYVNAAGELELHESVDSLGSAAVDVDETLIAAELELLTGFLVDESRTVDCEDAFVGRQGNRALNYCAGSLHCLYDLLGRLVDEVVIVALQFDSNFLAHIIEDL